MTGRLLREPLVHFLVLGAALFALYALVGGEGDAPAGEIVVTEGRVRNLAETFTRTWQRPPTAVELDNLVEDFIREEVLYREAVALGLDRDDTVIRRRLRQKLEFVSGDAIAAEPTEAELAALLAANPDAYRVEALVDFSQVFLDPVKRGGALDADAAAFLDALRGGRASAEQAGDGRMLEPRYARLSETDVERLFGADFAAALRDRPIGEWFGPVRSGYGVHLMLIEARTPGRPALPGEVRDQLVRDWAAGLRQRALDEQYAGLRSRYVIRIEGRTTALPPAAAAPAP